MTLNSHYTQKLIQSPPWLNHKIKSTTFLEDNKGENICSLGVKKDFLGYKKYQKMIKYLYSPSRMTKLKRKKKKMDNTTCWQKSGENESLIRCSQNV